jgi:hypothetical protein
VLLAKYYEGHKIKKDEIGRACNTYGGQEIVYRVCVGNITQRSHLEDQEVHARIILKWILKKTFESPVLDYFNSG